MYDECKQQENIVVCNENERRRKKWQQLIELRNKTKQSVNDLEFEQMNPWQIFNAILFYQICWQARPPRIKQFTIISFEQFSIYSL